MRQEDNMLWLNAALDGEIDIEHSAELQARLVRDPALKAAWEQHQALRAAVRERATYHEAPLPMRARIAEAIDAQSSPGAPARPTARATPAPMLVSAGRRRWSVVAASVLVGALCGAGLTWFMAERGLVSREAVERVAEDAVAGHIRANMTDRLVDVASSDQHTVRPWLSARLTYAVPVPDLSAHGFELIGARRDVIDGQAAAVLVYRRRQHVISAFLHPVTSEAGAPAGKEKSVRGFNVVVATLGAMRCSIVSDLNARELGDFAQLLQVGG